jgi:copper chaperone CopZ
MESNCINFRVAGMVQRGGFVWSGCPDAVRAAISALQGVVHVAYDAQEDLFSVCFDTQKTRLEDIFAAVYLAGRQAGQDYLPRMVSWKSPRPAGIGVVEARNRKATSGVAIPHPHPWIFRIYQAFWP